MKNKILLGYFIVQFTFKANAQKSIVVLNDVPNHIGDTITILNQTIDFDSRKNYWYLYFGNRYPKQLLTIMIKKVGKKSIKLNMDIFLGRTMVEFTGKIITYEGEPDSSSNPEIKKIKREVETDKDFTIAGEPIKMHIMYTPHVEPINLKGKTVMIITDRKQIGDKKYPVKLSLYY